MENDDRNPSGLPRAGGCARTSSGTCHPHRPRAVAHQRRDPFLHLARGLVGEGDREDLHRLHAVLREQIGDPVGEHPRLARTAPATMSSGLPACTTAARCCGLSPACSLAGSAAIRLRGGGAAPGSSTGARIGRRPLRSLANLAHLPFSLKDTTTPSNLPGGDARVTMWSVSSHTARFFTGTGLRCPSDCG